VDVKGKEGSRSGGLLTFRALDEKGCERYRFPGLLVSLSACFKTSFLKSFNITFPSTNRMFYVLPTGGNCDAICQSTSYFSPTCAHDLLETPEGSNKAVDLDNLQYLDQLL
jgi:hypothetical protein